MPVPSGFRAAGSWGSRLMLVFWVSRPTIGSARTQRRRIKNERQEHLGRRWHYCRWLVRVRPHLNNSGTWVASDINRKQNIQPFTGATAALMHLNAYTYEYTLSPDEIAKGEQPARVAGLIAQEVIEVLPEAVEISDSGEHFMNYDQVIPLLLEALKDQVLTNDVQQARIEDLEGRLAALEAVLSRTP